MVVVLESRSILNVALITNAFSYMHGWSTCSLCTIIRLSEMEPKWFVCEMSCYAFGGRIRRFAKVNANKVNMLYCIVLIIVPICSFRCTLSLSLQCV